MPQEARQPQDAIGLEALKARLHQDLRHLCYPRASWTPPRRQDGAPVHDVVIIGGGMAGLVSWLALTMAGIGAVRVLDRAPRGLEGPWLTYARMETLRSPKQLTGPAFGLGPLTYQAYHRARFGDADWEALDKIPRPLWMAYLRWYREALGVPVENGVSLDAIAPEGDLLRLKLSGADEPSILTRRLILATGRDGMGRANRPDFVADLPRALWAHSADEIDFDALRGKRVAVVGAGASAVDNAAEALEHGAAEIRHLIRRKDMPAINKLMGVGSYGFEAAFPDLSDAWRWKIMQYSFATQTPPPRGSTLRVSRHPNAFFHFGKAVETVAAQGAGLRIGFADATALETDFLILGTGFAADPLARREFGAAAAQIRLWRDAYAPPEGLENADLGRFPYLSADFSLQEKTPGAAPWLGRVHCFNYGASASLGKVSGDIPGISDGASWLARAIASSLYREDMATHWSNLENYATPELQGDEWRASMLPGEGGGA